jgi:hypothetical protein
MKTDHFTKPLRGGYNTSTTIYDRHRFLNASGFSPVNRLNVRLK